VVAALAIGTTSGAARPSTAARVPYIDAHAHLEAADIVASARAAREALKTENASRIIVMPPPFAPSDAPKYDGEMLTEAVRADAGSLSFLGGGGTLNTMIQAAVLSQDVSRAATDRFKARAEDILRQGAIGFGELTTEHFSGATAYQNAPTDHPFMLLLADIAAAHDVVIDLHMEAVPSAMKLPVDLSSPPNPPMLHENIAAFERLIDHNTRARIAWAHAGSDGTGQRTPALMRRLLQAHANLFIELKLDPSNRGRNYPLTGDGQIDPTWLRLLQDFPDRFVIGTDQHYPTPAATAQRWEAAVALLNQLPPALAQRIGFENAISIYRLRPR
jgi:hypothetical protein